jgi:hypothetical protein
MAQVSAACLSSGRMHVFARTGPATRTGSIAAISKRFKPMILILSSSKGGESATAYDP